MILKPFQYSCFNENDPNLPQLVSVLKNPNEVYHRLQGIAEAVLEGGGVDPTKGATYYANLSLCNPKWAKKFTETVKIGRHTFFREDPLKRG